MKHVVGLLCVVLTAIGGIAGVGQRVTPVAHAAPLQPLAGETFTGFGSWSATCQDQLSGSFTYFVSGTAAGPYPGTFEESGFVRIITGRLHDFIDTFSITSGANTVTGLENLRDRNGVGFQCVPGAEITFPVGTTYQAFINGVGVVGGPVTATVVLAGVVPPPGGAVQMHLDETFTTPGHRRRKPRQTGQPEPESLAPGCRRLAREPTSAGVLSLPPTPPHLLQPKLERP